MAIELRIIDREGTVLAAANGDQYVELLYKKEYAEGDSIVLSLSNYNQHVVWQVDDALGSAQCYVTDVVTYQVPFGEKKRVYSPKTFSGTRHHLYARIAEPEEVCAYRNIALNVSDQHDVDCCFPHASANVETRGESTFAARNAIDGLCANSSHGRWPYSSWGINRDPNAKIKIDFGRKVWIDSLAVYLRADFPHDSYWLSGVVEFSDGTTEMLHFEKTARRQRFKISPREVAWLTMDRLIKSDDPSPFPALSQLEVYGKDL